MSEAARRERQVKKGWAVPGSAHDRLVRIAKVALPSLAGILLAVLALAPLEKQGDVSFLLDKNEVENAPERMRVEEARYVGEDDEGRKFEIVAGNAVQQSSDEPVVNIRDMRASLALPAGPTTITAALARYDLDTQRVRIPGDVRVVGPDNYRLATRDVIVDLKSGRMTGGGGVRGTMPLGRFDAGSLSADLRSRTVELGGRARLKIVQGAVR